LRDDGFFDAAKGAEQVQSIGTFEGFAVHANKGDLRAVGEQPLPEQSIEQTGIDCAEHPLEGAFAGRFPPPGGGIEPGAERTQLGLGQLRCDRGQVRQRAPAGQYAHGRGGEDPVQSMASPGGPPGVRQLVKRCDQSAQSGHGKTIARRRFSFTPRQGLRQLCGPQPLSGSGVQELHPQLLRATMLLIVVTSGASPACGAAEGLPAGCLVTGPLIQIGIHEALHHDDGVSVHPGKILPQPFPGQFEDPARQIGATLLRQDQETALLGDEVPAAFPLFGRPLQPRVAYTQVQTGTCVTEQGDPLAAAVDRHVTQGRPHQRGIVQVVFALQQRVETGSFVFFDQPQTHFAKEGLLCGGGKDSVGMSGHVRWAWWSVRRVARKKGQSAGHRVFDRLYGSSRPCLPQTVPQDKATTMTPRRAPERPTPGKLLQLKIVLRHLKPPVWRRLLVSDRVSLDQLHGMIQKIMGWDNSHMHAFYVDGVEYAGFETARECGVHCDEEFYLHQLIKRPRQRFTYEYDFGDRWMHEILVEKTQPCPTQPPPARCLAGARACPPEDVGGPHSYLAFLHDRASAKTELLERWGEPAWVLAFQPELFDLDEINRRLT